MKQVISLKEKRSFRTMGSLKSAYRRGFSRGLAFGLILLAVFIVLTGSLLYGQGSDDALFIDPQGHIGIGTTQPEAALDVKGSVAVSGQVGVGTANPGNSRLAIQEADSKPGSGLQVINAKGDKSAGFWVGETSGALEGNDTTDLLFRTGGQDRMCITSHGSVGVGTSEPKATLDVQSNPRTGSHPPSVNGLYVTGDFGADNNGVEFRHSNGTQGIGFGYNTIYATGEKVDQDLNLKPRGKEGKVNVQGGLTFKGRYQKDDDEVKPYEISPRYHLTLTAPTYAKSSKKIPQKILESLCADVDGCQVRIGMTKWSNDTNTETASRSFLFSYSSENGHWRASSGVAGWDPSGVDGDGRRNDVIEIWHTCYFSDSSWSRGVENGDRERGMELLLWDGYKGANRTCELTLID